MSPILKFDFQKKKTITFLWSKLSKLHEKDPMLHVTTTFSIKQEETRTNSVPIPLPLLLTWSVGFISSSYMATCSPFYEDMSHISMSWSNAMYSSVVFCYSYIFTGETAMLGVNETCQRALLQWQLTEDDWF